ncbi:MAG: FMN-binding protein [Clostridia bacterium]|nr:FMN-binding protein [Clostridia bacterium]
MKHYLKPVISLTVICLTVGLLLSVVNVLTADKIAENLSAAEKAAVEKVFGAGVEYSRTEGAPDTVDTVYRVTSDGEMRGYCVTVSPNGFGGNIDMVVGVASDGKIIGVAITALSETPGLGSRVNDDGYLSGYNGHSGQLALGTDVQAISGATISSRSVMSGVNTALGALASMGLVGEEKANG